MLSRSFFDVMRQFPLLALIVLSLAACSSAPPNTARSNASASDAFRTKPRGLPNFVDHSVGREEISVQAMSLVGVPYRWAGNTPTTGFDCSGLVQYVVARAADVKLPRTTAEISQSGSPVDPGQIAPGDLVFFNTMGRPHSHVGIYVGKLRFVNAPSTGGIVRLDYLTNPYWAKRFDGIRRVAPPLQPTPFDSPTYLAAPREVPVPAPATAQTNAARAETARGPIAESAAQALARAERYQPLSERSDPWADIDTSTRAGTSAQPASASANDDPIGNFATSDK